MRRPANPPDRGAEHVLNGRRDAQSKRRWWAAT
jgi:hypothetical protein